MKRIQITKRKKKTLHSEDLLREKRSDRMELDEKRKVGDECGRPVRGDEEVQGLKNHSGQGGSCESEEKRGIRPIQLVASGLRGERWG